MLPPVRYTRCTHPWLSMLPPVRYTPDAPTRGCRCCHSPGGQRRHPERRRSPVTLDRLWTAELMPHKWGHAPLWHPRETCRAKIKICATRNPRVRTAGVTPITWQLPVTGHAILRLAPSLSQLALHQGAPPRCHWTIQVCTRVGRIPYCPQAQRVPHKWGHAPTLHPPKSGSVETQNPHYRSFEGATVGVTLFTRQMLPAANAVTQSGDPRHPRRRMPPSAAASTRMLPRHWLPT